MSNPNIVSALLVFLVGVASAVALYHAAGLVRIGFGKGSSAASGALSRRPIVAGSSLDAHIVTEWTEGRLRLDALLALLKALGASLEEQVERLKHLGPTHPRYNREARNMVGPTLRRFTFDKHLRDECRVLVPLLQFCASDLMEVQGMDMTEKLSALAQIQVALESGGRD
jgi:hypothetical protein